VSIILTPLCGYQLGPNLVECGQPTVTTIAYGCRHEHIVRAQVCRRHANEEIAAALDEPGMGCDECQEVGCWCRAAVREEPGSTSLDLTGSFSSISFR
jgi:hypothetical protein